MSLFSRSCKVCQSRVCGKKLFIHISFAFYDLQAARIILLCDVNCFRSKRQQCNCRHLHCRQMQYVIICFLFNCFLMNKNLHESKQRILKLTTQLTFLIATQIEINEGKLISTCNLNPLKHGNLISYYFTGLHDCRLWTVPNSWYRYYLNVVIK